MSGVITVAAVGVTSATMGITLSTIFPGTSPGILVGALAGTALYVLTAEPYALWKQVMFSVISFIVGVWMAGPVTSILDGLVNTVTGNLHPPIVVQVSPSVGAVVSAAIAIAVLLRILKRSQKGPNPGLDEGE